MRDAPADVAIVGGGVIGCSVAHHASRRGASVTLFETEGIGDGASGATAGVLLSPIAGASIAALALGEEPPADLSPFSPERFAE